MARKHKEDEVLRFLHLKKDIKIFGYEIQILSDYVFKEGEKIVNPKKSFDLGNGSWGRIDFLVKYCGYRRFYVSDF